MYIYRMQMPLPLKVDPSGAVIFPLKGQVLLKACELLFNHTICRKPDHN